MRFTVVMAVLLGAAAIGVALWVSACGPREPGFDDGTYSDPGSRKDCCCHEGNILAAYAGGGGSKDACPPGFTYHSPSDCPGGLGYPNASCNFDWHDAGTPAPDAGDAGGDDGGASAFCCCAGLQTTPPVDADGGPGCPDGYQKLTPDLCPGGANYPNGLCGQ